MLKLNDYNLKLLSINVKSKSNTKIRLAKAAPILAKIYYLGLSHLAMTLIRVHGHIKTQLNLKQKHLLEVRKTKLESTIEQTVNSQVSLTFKFFRRRRSKNLVRYW